MWTKQKLGVAAWTMGERPYRQAHDKPLPDIAQRIQALNYDGLTLTIDPERDTALSIAQILKENNLELFAIAPPEVDLAHPETAVRQSAIDQYLNLVDFAVHFGEPLLICRGMKGRIRPLQTLTEERQLFSTAIRQIAHAADENGLRLIIEPLNRYETHLFNNVAETLEMLDAIAMENVGAYLNAFHMNIEEQDDAGMIRQVGDRLWLYAISDSNRRAIGKGHIKLGNHLWALEDIGYSGPIILECLPPGTDPLQPILDDPALLTLEGYLRDSRSWF